MGLVGLDKDDLEVRLDAKEEDEPDPKEREKMPLEKKQIRRILPLKSDHHVLLVTLLLLNSAANEMLPLWLDRIVPQWAAIVLSVTLVLVFGEILPSAIFTGPNQIPIAAAFAPVGKHAFDFPPAWRGTFSSATSFSFF
jgi:hypothetical protein